MARNAVGIAHDSDGVTIEKRDCFAVDLVSSRAVKLEIACCGGDIRAALFQRLTRVDRFKLRQRLVVAQNSLTQFDQQAAAISRSHAPPRTLFKGCSRG